jgi:UDP-2,4-diacetamido-2,4,6-trideoxy-beta-L-altropyranose hydrolase
MPTGATPDAQRPGPALERQTSARADDQRKPIPRIDGRRLAFRCDGDDRIGAGHVARCIPLAEAFTELGWRVAFVGEFQGLAGWLLARAGIANRPPDPSAPCGLRADSYEAAVLDSYSIAPSSICALAGTLPIATVAEANRCLARGVLLDYHLDRCEPQSARLLAGPAFAPLQQTLAGAGRAAEEIRGVLVTMGGSLRARHLVRQIAPMAGAAFPDARILLAGGAESQTAGGTRPETTCDAEPETTGGAESETAGGTRPETAGGAGSETVESIDSRFVHLSYPSLLRDALSQVDVAITAAGWTAYELACAGVPQVALAIAPNQRRVVKGLSKRDIAICMDLTAGDSMTDLPAALQRLANPSLRRELADRGMKTFDARGARRAAIALSERWVSSVHT